jgi:uncharacterized membrane protein YhaH (DUF805 family)
MGNDIFSVQNLNISNRNNAFPISECCVMPNIAVCVKEWSDILKSGMDFGKFVTGWLCLSAFVSPLQLSPLMIYTT